MISRFTRYKLEHLLTTPLYSNAIYLMMSTFTTASLGFIFWVVVARFYAETEVGFGSAIISAACLLATLSLVGSDVALVRFLPQTKQPIQLVNTTFTLTILISVVVSTIFLLNIEFLSPALSFIKGDIIYSMVLIIFTPLWALSMLLDNTFIAKQKANFVWFKNTVFSITRFLPLILLGLFFHSFGIVASWCLAIGVAITISTFMFLPKVINNYRPIPTLNINLIRHIWKYSGGNYISVLFIVVPPLVLPIIVVNQIGPVENAYYYISWIIATALFAIPASTSRSLFAEGANAEGRLKENATKTLKFTFLLLTPATIVFILLGKWILLAFGQSYSLNALKLLWVFALSSFPIGVNTIYMSVLRVTGEIKKLAVIWGFIAITWLSISYSILPLTGIIGIGYALLGTQTVVAIYTLISSSLIRK